MTDIDAVEQDVLDQLRRREAAERQRQDANSIIEEARWRIDECERRLSAATKQREDMDRFSFASLRALFTGQYEDAVAESRAAERSATQTLADEEARADAARQAAAAAQAEIETLADLPTLLASAVDKRAATMRTEQPDASETIDRILAAQDLAARSLDDTLAAIAAASRAAGWVSEALSRARDARTAPFGYRSAIGMAALTISASVDLNRAHAALQSAAPSLSRLQDLLGDATPIVRIPGQNGEKGPALARNQIEAWLGRIISITTLRSAIDTLDHLLRNLRHIARELAERIPSLTNDARRTTQERDGLLLGFDSLRFVPLQTLDDTGSA